LHAGLARQHNKSKKELKKKCYCWLFYASSFFGFPFGGGGIEAL
jgi:hypothetical protein